MGGSNYWFRAPAVCYFDPPFLRRATTFTAARHHHPEAESTPSSKPTKAATVPAPPPVPLPETTDQAYTLNAYAVARTLRRVLEGRLIRPLELSLRDHVQTRDSSAPTPSTASR